LILVTRPSPGSWLSLPKCSGQLARSFVAGWDFDRRFVVDFGVGKDFGLGWDFDTDFGFDWNSDTIFDKCFVFGFGFS